MKKTIMEVILMTVLGLINLMMITEDLPVLTLSLVILNSPGGGVGQAQRDTEIDTYTYFVCVCMCVSICAYTCRPLHILEKYSQRDIAAYPNNKKLALALQRGGKIV